MQDRIMKLRWPGEIPVKYFHSVYCPHSLFSMESQLFHFCDWLNYVTGIPIHYAGRVNDEPRIGDPGFHVAYVDQEEIDSRATQSDIWAMTHRLGEGFEMTSILCRYGHSKVAELEKFAGISPHELMHGLGIEHYDDLPSMMNASPYQHYPYQALVRAEDFYPLHLLARKPLDGHPSAYDYGDINRGECLIHIPSIIAWGRRHSVTLRGFQEGSEWFLEADRNDYQLELRYLKPVCYLQGGLLFIPIRYHGASLVITAEHVNGNQASSKVRFQVKDISPA